MLNHGIDRPGRIRLVSDGVMWIWPSCSQGPISQSFVSGVDLGDAVAAWAGDFDAKPKHVYLAAHDRDICCSFGSADELRRYRAASLWRCR